MNLTPHGLARVALRAALAIVALAWIAYLGLLFRGELVLLKDLLPGFAEAQAALGPLPDSSIPGVVGVFLLAVSACLKLFFVESLVTTQGAVFVFLLYVLQSTVMIVAGLVPLYALRLRMVDLVRISTVSDSLAESAPSAK